MIDSCDCTVTIRDRFGRHFFLKKCGICTRLSNFRCVLNLFKSKNEISLEKKKTGSENTNSVSENSMIFKIKFGVPQGLLLVPLFFKYIYLNTEYISLI